MIVICRIDGQAEAVAFSDPAVFEGRGNGTYVVGRSDEVFLVDPGGHRLDAIDLLRLRVVLARLRVSPVPEPFPFLIVFEDGLPPVGDAGGPVGGQGEEGDACERERHGLRQRGLARRPATGREVAGHLLRDVLHRVELGLLMLGGRGRLAGGEGDPRAGRLAESVRVRAED